VTGLLPLVFVALLLALILVVTASAAPRTVSGILHIAAPAGLIVAALGLMAFRQFALAFGLLAVALGLIGRMVRLRQATPSAGGTSEVRTAGIAMTLDHDTGTMDGEVLTGPYEGARLSELDPAELQDLLDQFADDPDTAALLQSYLERHDLGTEPPPESSGQPMSDAEALKVLGLEPGASPEQIRAAHRRLIRKVHPDLGGSAALAAMINAAKQRLDPG
jgi:hypothetical protein